MRAFILALVSLLVAPALAASPLTDPPPPYLTAGTRGYVYGLPLVIMELTRELGPVNQLSHVRQLATPDYHYIVRPNNEFNLLFRAYQPQDPLLDGTYRLPAVTRARP